MVVPKRNSKLTKRKKKRNLNVAFNIVNPSSNGITGYIPESTRQSSTITEAPIQNEGRNSRNSDSSNVSTHFSQTPLPAVTNNQSDDASGIIDSQSTISGSNCRSVNAERQQKYRKVNKLTEHIQSIGNVNEQYQVLKSMLNKDNMSDLANKLGLGCNQTQANHSMFQQVQKFVDMATTSNGKVKSHTEYAKIDAVDTVITSLIKTPSPAPIL